MQPGTDVSVKVTQWDFPPGCRVAVTRPLETRPRALSSHAGTCVSVSDSTRFSRRGLSLVPALLNSSFFFF